MLSVIIAAIVLTAVAVVLVSWLIRRASVDPATWARRNGGADDAPKDDAGQA